MNELHEGMARLSQPRPKLSLLAAVCCRYEL